MEGISHASKDKFHDVVIRALQKDGLTVIKEQQRLYIDSRILKIDVHLKNQEDLEILVEIKSFDSGSPVIDISDAVGKYAVYRAILDDSEDKRQLYLAIPKTAHDGIFSERLGQLLMARLELKIIVYDVKTETIVLWIH
jgi:hypothetical protein